MQRRAPTRVSVGWLRVRLRRELSHLNKLVWTKVEAWAGNARVLPEQVHGIGAQGFDVDGR